MKRLPLYSLLTACFMGSAAAACPWASGTYSSTVPPDISFKFTFDANCKTVAVTQSGAKTQSYPLSQGAKGWSVAFGQYKVVFDTKGKRANGSRGGAARSMKMRKL